MFDKGVMMIQGKELSCEKPETSRDEMPCLVHELKMSEKVDGSRPTPCFLSKDSLSCPEQKGQQLR